MPLHDDVGINCEKGVYNYLKSRRISQVYGLRGVC